MKTTKFLFFFCLSILFTNCSYDSEDDLIAEEIIEDNDDNDDDGVDFSVTYDNDVRPILQASCISCHASPPVNGAPFALINYNQVSQRANIILQSMSRPNGAAGAMPPSGRLPQATIDIIQDWIDEGKPEN